MGACCVQESTGCRYYTYLFFLCQSTGQEDTKLENSENRTEKKKKTADSSGLAHTRESVPGL